MEVALDHGTRSSDDESTIGSEVDSDVEHGLKARNRRHVLTKPDNRKDENTTYLDKNGGAIEDLKIQNLLNAFPYDANYKNGGTEIETAKEKSEQIGEEIMEEEVVLEFEKAIAKRHTHTMHCPNCNQQITRVKLRRKFVRMQPLVTEERHEPVDLLGCLSCFSLFSFTGNGGFNPFRIFENKPPSSVVGRIDGNDNVVREDAETVTIAVVSDVFYFRKDMAETTLDWQHVDREGHVAAQNCFSIFRVVFGRDKDSKETKPVKINQDSDQLEPEQVDQDSKQPKLGKLDPDFEKPKTGKVDHPSPPITTIDHVINKLPIQKGENYESGVEGEPSKLEKQPPNNSVPSHYGQLPSSFKPPQINDSHIDIHPVTSSESQVPTLGSARQDSTSFEILKSIVYGGLMEVIASLSIVASAAAGDATTLNIIALALANLIGGIFVIGHNLWDLKDDCYKFSTQETNNQESRNKYKELLGSVEHFPMHVFFAILSFLVFGIIPPVAYGFSFHETNDKDFTMVIVAAASFVCVGLLAIFKAYIDRCTEFLGYVKTIMYYLTTAVTVSGVSYMVGNLAKRLIEEFGLFETGSDVAMAVLPEVMSTDQSLAYY